MRSVVLLGATGLVGSELLTALLDDGSVRRVTVIARRSTGRSHSKLTEALMPLGEMASRPELFAADHLFCALGTTIRVAGSQEKFREIDYTFPLDAARLGLSRGVAHYLLVSALGADASSRIFYNRVKGELERDLTALGYRSLTIARPSLLLGERDQFRFGEELAKRVGWLTPPKYRPVQARSVARALVQAAREDQPGVRIMESRELRHH